MPDSAPFRGSFPRLLFITPAAFNRTSGGGITFSNLFRGWPKDHIATVHSDPTPVTTDICERYYRLGEAEIATWLLLRRLRGPAASSAAALGSGAANPSLRHRLKSIVFGDGLPERGHLSPRLRSWIAEYRPDLIYTILGGIGLMELIEAVRRDFALPLALHFMDDWQAAIHRGGFLSPLQRRQMQRLVARLVAAAEVRLGICEAMCEDYARRWGRSFTPFQNAVDVARWRAFAKRDLAVGTPIRLLYTGSVLGFAQAASLADCCAVVAALAGEGLAITLDIHSPLSQTAPLRHRLECGGAVRIHDTIAADEDYFRTLAAADILLLPVNFDAHSQRYIRLSMPTKVPAYLVSGTPVLAYGPPETAQIAYARAGGWAHVVDRRDPAALGAAIRRLASDMTLRRQLSAAQRSAAARHDAATIRPRFQATLAGARRQVSHA